MRMPGRAARGYRRSVPRVEETFNAEPRNISAARRFVADTLAEWDATAFEWAAVTAASELATNALLHAGTGFTLSLRLDGGRLRLAVTDQSVRPPQQRGFGAHAATGRGLNLVYALSAAHGIESSAAGKTVWCDVRADADYDVGLAYS
jgi:anti-sigma regulatory factor (Ser/Thr protein kinase)